MEFFNFHRFTNSSFIPEDYIRATIEKNSGLTYVTAPNDPSLFNLLFYRKIQCFKGFFWICMIDFLNQIGKRLKSYLNKSRNPQVVNPEEKTNCQHSHPSLLNMRYYLYCLPLLTIEDLKSASKKDFYQK